MANLLKELADVLGIREVKSGVPYVPKRERPKRYPRKVETISQPKTNSELDYLHHLQNPYLRGRG